MQELTITMSKMLACAGASILGSASKRRRVSCRNGRLATTNPWSERTGGQTSTVGVQSSRVMTTSNQPPPLCVGTDTCCVSPNCSSICWKLVAEEEEEGVASWRFRVDGRLETEREDLALRKREGLAHLGESLVMLIGPSWAHKFIALLPLGTKFGAH